MTVNVLDKNTSLTYAVEYEPANLVRKPVKVAECSWEAIRRHIQKEMLNTPINELPEKKPFIDRVNKIAAEIESMNDRGDIPPHTAVVFLALERRPLAPSASIGCVCGHTSVVSECVAAACKRDKCIAAAAANAFFTEEH